MFKRLLARLFGTAGRKPGTQERDFETLNRHAPLRSATATPRPEGHAEPEPPSGFICRETILGRDHRVAGYQFMLQHGTRERIRSRSRRIHHVYAEVLVRNILKLDVLRLLGHRRAFLDVPDSFLEHPSITELPPAATVLIVGTIPSAEPIDPSRVIESVRRLRALGYRIAIDVSTADAPGLYLLPQADFAVVDAGVGDPERLRTVADQLRKSGAKTQILARDIPTHDDFLFCFGLGTALFQGPFITRREDWSGNTMGPNTARIADLLARLRREESDAHEIAQILQQDPALSLRLMRYINSASIGMRDEITSIERALLLLGREKTYRWLMLLIYSADKGSARSAALLESALVRARMMELVGANRPERERDALFLVGLLSLVDAMLQIPLQEAMASLSTAPEIEAAVVRGEGPMADLLTLAIACENDDLGSLTAAAEKCGVTPEYASEQHLLALVWALDVAD
ncbi:EAL and HDOD domain-containing protein [Dokdonella sp. MW10]|uniref:EAL and HDOD domain-containing protein n=1 Tax=Dokdonella sp. MW10 TaxID=2992926 RepID=UPI003F7E3DED